MNIISILNAVRGGKQLYKNEAVALININNNSFDFYKIISVANEMTRSEFQNKGYIFAQIGLNAEPCPIDCKFCSMGKSHYSMETTWRKDINSIKENLQECEIPGGFLHIKNLRIIFYYFAEVFCFKWCSTNKSAIYVRHWE